LFLIKRARIDIQPVLIQYSMKNHLYREILKTKGCNGVMHDTGKQKEKLLQVYLSGMVVSKVA
jgi:hypothetical protein